MSEAFAGNALIQLPAESNSPSLIAKPSGKGGETSLPDPQELGEEVTGTETHPSLFLGASQGAQLQLSIC